MLREKTETSFRKADETAEQYKIGDGKAVYAAAVKLNKNQRRCSPEQRPFHDQSMQKR
jgi:hypothetical protein